MTDRDRLAELIKNALSAYGTKVNADCKPQDFIADFIVANGVTVDDANNATTTWRPASVPPKESGSYLTLQKSCGKYFYQEVCKFATNLKKVDKETFNKCAGWYGYDGEWGYYTVDDILYWMPLPELPKEVE